MEFTFQKKDAQQNTRKKYNMKKLLLIASLFIYTDSFCQTERQIFEYPNLKSLISTAKKVAILPFIQDVFAKRPINVEVTGFVKVKFIGINYTLNFDNETFQYSSDLLRDLGLSKKVGSFKEKNPALAKFLGIK